MQKISDLEEEVTVAHTIQGGTSFADGEDLTATVAILDTDDPSEFVLFGTLRLSFSSALQI